MFFSDEQWLGWLDELAEKDYVTIDDFISEEMFRDMMDFFRETEEDDRLKKAGIGSHNDLQYRSEIRGDFIYWLDRNRDHQLTSFFDLMAELRDALKRYCYLSLSDSEFHIAKYPPGSFYKKHLDQFHERSNRQITVLVYLNEGWQKGDGGELKIHGTESDFIIEPVARRLLLFKSDKIEHEVLMTHKSRYSLTGWLLHQPAGLGNLFRA